MADVKVEEGAPLVPKTEVVKTLEEMQEKETDVVVEPEKENKEVEQKAAIEKCEAEPVAAVEETTEKAEAEPVAAVKEEAAPVADAPQEEKALEEKTE